MQWIQRARSFHISTLTIFVIGILLRLTIAPFTLNWDFHTNIQVSSTLLHGSIADMYKDERAYPLPTHLISAAGFTLLSPLLPPEFIEWTTRKDLAVFATPYLYRYLLLLKLPIIAFELCAAFIFSRLFPKGVQKKLLALWLLNPITLYIVPAFTNVDAYPMFFLLLHYLLFRKGEYLLAGVSLGLAGSLKLFPVILLPFLLLSVRSFKHKIFTLVAFLVAYLLPQLPALGIPEYVRNVLLGGNSNTILFSGLKVGPDRILLLFPILYFLMLFWYKSIPKSFHSFFVATSTTIGVMLLVGQFHLQWLLWIFPFVISSVFTTRQSNLAVCTLFGAFTGMVAVSQASLNIGMLATLDPTLWQLDWPLKLLIGQNVFSLLNLFQSIFAASLIWITIQNIRSVFQRNEYLPNDSK
jgi:hypothetical protein